MTQNRPSTRRASSSADAGRDQTRRRPIVAALASSAILHLVILFIFLPPSFDAPAEQPKKEDKLEVTTTFRDAPPDELLDQPEDPPDEALAQLDQPEDEPELPQEEPPEPEGEPEPEVEEEAPPPEPLPEKQRKMVQQKTNEEAPEEADFLSDEANRVEEETRAEETTELDVLPGDSIPEDLSEETGGDEESALEEQDEQDDEESALAEEDEEILSDEEETEQLAQEDQEDAPPETQQAEEEAPPQESGIDESDEALAENPFLKKSEQKDDAAIPPKSLFGPSPAEYEEKFAEADKKAAETAKTPKKGRRMLEGWKDRERAMRASLENTITEVRPGNHTGVNAAASVYAGFIARIHRKLHPLWGNGFLPRLDSQYSAGHPLSNPRLEVTLEYIIDAASGEVDAVNIARSSGETIFDGEGVMIFHQIGPHTKAPKEIISPDGKVYIHWTLWRDQQQCGPWGAHIFIVENGKKKRVDTDGSTIKDG